MESERDRDRLLRLQEAARTADLLSRTLRDALCSTNFGQHRDRLRWWSCVVDDAAEDLLRLEKESWQ